MYLHLKSNLFNLIALIIGKTLQFFTSEFL